MGPDELASRASISRTALYQIESGRTEQPRAATLRRIALALDIPTEALLGPHLGIVALGYPNSEARAFARPAEPSMPTHLRIDEAPMATRGGDLDRKFRELLASPLGEGVAKIVEESYRILPQPLAEPRW